ALDVAVTRDVTRKSVWRPSNTKVRDWQNEALNHYELLELSRDAGDEIIQSRIALLDQALERWSRDPDARLQEGGKEGKKRIRRLKDDVGDRENYDRHLDRQQRQKKIEEVIESVWGFMDATKILTAEMWQRLQYRADANGLDQEALEQIIQALRERGVQTGLSIGGREVRTLEELKEICEGHGKKLEEVFGSGDLERWLQTAV